MRHTARDGTRGIRKIDVLSHHAGGEYLLLYRVCVVRSARARGGVVVSFRRCLSDAWVGSPRISSMVVVVVVVVRTSPAYVIHPKIAVPVLAASPRTRHSRQSDRSIYNIYKTVHTTTNKRTTNNRTTEQTARPRDGAEAPSPDTRRESRPGRGALPLRGGVRRAGSDIRRRRHGRAEARPERRAGVLHGIPAPEYGLARGEFGRVRRRRVE